MQKYFFDMKDGVPLRDRIGMEFKNNADAIAHCVVLAEHFYRDSLTDDQDLEISVVNALGRRFIASSFIDDSGLLRSRFADACDSGLRA